MYTALTFHTSLIGYLLINHPEALQQSDLDLKTSENVQTTLEKVQRLLQLLEQGETVSSLRQLLDLGTSVDYLSKSMAPKILSESVNSLCRDGERAQYYMKKPYICSLSTNTPKAYSSAHPSSFSALRLMQLPKSHTESS